MCVCGAFFRYLIEQQQLLQVPGQIWLGSAAPVAGCISPGRRRHGHKFRVTSVLEEGHENVQSHPCLSSQGCLLPHCSLAYIWAALLFLRTTHPTASMAERIPFQKYTWGCTSHGQSANGRARGLLCWAEHVKSVTNSDLPLPRPSNHHGKAPPWFQQPAPALEQGSPGISQRESRAG